MRDKLAYKLMCFILNYVATKKYKSLMNVTTGLGMFILEDELIAVGEDNLSDQAQFGEYVYYNWNEFEDGI